MFSAHLQTSCQSNAAFPGDKVSQLSQQLEPRETTQYSSIVMQGFSLNGTISNVT